MSNEKQTTSSTKQPFMQKGPMGMGGRVAEKPKNFKHSMKKLLVFAKPYWFISILALTLSMIGSILQLVGPNKLQDITNLIREGLFTGINLTRITEIGILLVVLLVLGSIFSYIQGFITAGVTQKVTQNLRNKISVKINKLPLKVLDGKPHGEILSRVTNDVDTIGQSLNNSIVSVVSGITLLVGSAFMMFYTNWIMALSAIGASLVGIFGMGFIMSKSQKFFRQQQTALGELNGHIEEIYSGHNVVKAYNAEEEVTKHFHQVNDKLFASAWKSQFLSGLMMPVMNFVGNLGYVVVCVVGASLALSNIISFGVIVAFMIYIRYFSQPLGQLAQAMTNLQSAAAASERVFEFLDEKELEDESHKTKQLTNVRGDVEFKQVKFGYVDGVEVIHNFSISIQSGQKVAIVGPTGAGKTTLVNLLMRFYEINGGNIFIDGVSVQDLKRDNVHNLFGMVLQDTWLFEDTIKNNIIYSEVGVTDEQVVQACKAVGLDHFIRTLPKGYDTVLNDVTALSSGQKQLLTIARAMVQNSPMLILDEATSSVDTRTEILIQQAMDKITKGRTSFVIAHRLSTIKNADVILVMKNGDIVEQGNHNKLMEQKGFYAELYNSQFETV